MSSFERHVRDVGLTSFADTQSVQSEEDSQGGVGVVETFSGEEESTELAAVEAALLGWVDRRSADVLGRVGPDAPIDVSDAALSADQQEVFRACLVALPDEIEVLPLRQLAWPMALLQHRHRSEGRPLSAAMAEALAAAQALGGAIAVSSQDVGPNLKAAAEHDRVPFTIL